MENVWVCHTNDQHHEHQLRIAHALTPQATNQHQEHQLENAYLWVWQTNGQHHDRERRIAWADFTKAPQMKLIPEYFAAPPETETLNPNPQTLSSCKSLLVSAVPKKTRPTCSGSSAGLMRSLHRLCRRPLGGKRSQESLALNWHALLLQGRLLSLSSRAIPRPKASKYTLCDYIGRVHCKGA